MDSVIPGSAAANSIGLRGSLGGCVVGRSKSRSRKSAMPNTQQKNPIIMYKNDIENSKPRYNPVVMNNKPSRNHNCGNLSEIGLGRHISCLTLRLWVIKTTKMNSISHGERGVDHKTSHKLSFDGQTENCVT